MFVATPTSKNTLDDLALAPLVAIPVYAGVAALAGALGYGAYTSLFGTSQSTFEDGWKDGPTFDRRMAAAHQLWLEFDRAIQLRCPSFVKKDGGRWWTAFKAALNDFGAFYKKVGTHPGYFTGWVSSIPPGEQIGGAIARMEALVAWGQTVERDCPGTFPGLGIGLTPTEAERVAEQKKIEAITKDSGFLTNFGKGFGTTLALAMIGVGGFWYFTRERERRAALSGLRGYRYRRR